MIIGNLIDTPLKQRQEDIVWKNLNKLSWNKDISCILLHIGHTQMDRNICME